LSIGVNFTIMSSAFMRTSGGFGGAKSGTALSVIEAKPRLCV